MIKRLIPAKMDFKGHSNAHAVRLAAGSIVQQHLREEYDINTIVRRFGITGQVPEMQGAVGMFGDFTGIEDLQSAIERADDVRRRFQSLPPEVRNKYLNNPVVMARELGEAGDEELRALFGVPGAPAPAGDAPAAPEKKGSDPESGAEGSS